MLGVRLSFRVCVIFNSEAAIHTEQHRVQGQLEAGFEAPGGASRVTANAMLAMGDFSSALRPSVLTCSPAAQAGHSSTVICQEYYHRVPVVTDGQTAGTTLRNALLYTEARILVKTFGKHHFYNTTFLQSNIEPKQ